HAGRKSARSHTGGFPQGREQPEACSSRRPPTPTDFRSTHPEQPRTATVRSGHPRRPGEPRVVEADASPIRCRQRSTSQTRSGALVEWLEVVSDLIVEVAGLMLPRDRALHRLAVLSDDSEVLNPRGHAAAAPGQVRVVAFLAALARLALDADVERIGAQTLGRFALGRAAPALAGHEPLTLAEILVFRARAVAPRAVLAAPAPLGLPPAPPALARAP